jgi:hypothetical protein
VVSGTLAISKRPGAPGGDEVSATESAATVAKAAEAKEVDPTYHEPFRELRVWADH